VNGGGPAGASPSPSAASAVPSAGLGGSAGGRAQGLLGVKMAPGGAPHCGAVFEAKCGAGQLAGQAAPPAALTEALVRLGRGPGAPRPGEALLGARGGAGRSAPRARRVLAQDAGRGRRLQAGA